MGNIEKLNLKLFKDVSTKEIIISVGPYSDSLEKTIIQAISSIVNNSVTIQEINTLQEDTVYQQEEKDTTSIDKIKEAEKFIISSGAYKGLTPLQVIQNKNGFFTILKFCLKNKSNPDCSVYHFYVNALKEYMQTLNVDNLEKEHMLNIVQEFQKICPNLIKQLETAYDFNDTDCLRKAVKKCYKTAWKNI